MKRENTLLRQNISSPIELIDLDKLKPIEKVFPNHLQYIHNQIEKDGCINKPLIIDKLHHIILDGSHRYAYLKRGGYSLAPVIMVDYESHLISLGSHLIHRIINHASATISKKEVIQKALNSELFEPRSTRHFFPFRKTNHPTLLKHLKKEHKVNIDHLLSDANLQKQIENNVSYIKEIDCELTIINQYIQEQIEVKEYLKNQIENMQKVNQ